LDWVRLDWIGKKGTAHSKHSNCSTELYRHIYSTRLHGTERRAGTVKKGRDGEERDGEERDGEERDEAVKTQYLLCDVGQF